MNLSYLYKNKQKLHLTYQQGQQKSIRKNQYQHHFKVCFMFPRHNKFFKHNLVIDSTANSHQLSKNSHEQQSHYHRLSKDRVDINKSAQLTQTKKLSLNPYSLLNAQSKRPSLLIRGSYKRKQRFFTEQNKTELKPKKQEETQQSQSLSIGKNYNSVAQMSINKKSPKLRQRLIKQIYERQNTKIKRSNEESILSKSRQIVNSTSTNHTCSFITPHQLLKAKHNLTDFQIQEMISFEQIYYYGQHCKNKKFLKSQMQNINKQEQYPFEKGDHVMYRYQIVENLGQGSFGEVFKCYDYKRNKQLVALKIVKFNQKYAEQAKSQITILSHIKKDDPNTAKNCIQIKQCFVFRQRVCMTFDLLSMNLYELVKSNGYYGLPLDLIRRFVLQILNAIHYLHKLKIVHADLKPQNILLKEANKSGIRVIDFGSSCYENKTIYTYIQSRYYRAPEVILGMGYNRKIDVWSFGCIIAELFLGYPLFAGDDEHQQMCYITEVLGAPPIQMKQSAKRWHVFFDDKDNLKDHSKKSPPASKSLKDALQKPEDEYFIKFIKRCLQWRNPLTRVQALDLLKDEWIIKGLPQQFKQQHLKFIAEQQDEIQMNNRVSKYKKSKSKSFCIRENHTKISSKG